jgi:hypothetical protein
VRNHPDSSAARTGAIKWLVENADNNPRHAPRLLQASLEHISALDRLEAESPVPGLYRMLVYGRMSLYGIAPPGPLDIGELKRNLGSSRSTPLTVNLLGYTPTCIILGRCEIPEDIVLELFSSALGNDRIGGRDRAYLLAGRSTYHLSVTGDFEQGLEDIRLAANSVSNTSSYSKRWIEVLIHLQRPEQAKEVLREIGYRLTPSQRVELSRMIDSL